MSRYDVMKKLGLAQGLVSSVGSDQCEFECLSAGHRKECRLAFYFWNNPTSDRFLMVFYFAKRDNAVSSFEENVYLKSGRVS